MTNIINKTPKQELPETKILNLDGKDCFNLNLHEISSGKAIDYYDNSGTKIAEIRHENNRLSIEAYTKKTVNLLGKIKIAEFNVRTQGELNIQSQLDVETSINLIARELICEEKIICQGEIDINVKNDIICADDSLMQAKKLHLQAARCGFNGKINASESSVIEADRIDISNEVKLSGSHQINAKAWFVYKGAHIELSPSNGLKKSNIYVDDFKSGKGSYIKINNNDINPVIFSAKRFVLNGRADIQRTELRGDYFETGKKADINIDHSHVISKNTIILDGKVNCKGVDIDAPEISHVDSSQITYRGNEHHKSVIKTNLFIARGESELQHVMLNAERSYFYGNVTLKDVENKSENCELKPTILNCNRLIITSKEFNLNSQSQDEMELQSLFAVTERFETQGNIKLTDSDISTKTNRVCENHGSLHLHDSVIRCNGQLFNDEHAKIKVTHSENKKASIEISSLYNAGDMHLISTQLSAKNVSHLGNHLDAENDAKITVDENLCLADKAKMSLSEKSTLMADKATVFLAKATLEAKIGSSVQAKTIFSGSGSQFSLSQSSAKINDKLSILGKTNLENQSTLDTQEADVSGTLTSHTSKVIADRSDILGQVEAIKSQLDLGSKVVSRPGANVQLKDSFLRSKYMDHQGNMLVQREKTDKNAAQTKVNKETKKEKAEPTLKIEKFNSSFGSTIEGDDLSIETDEWEQYGDIQLTGSLEAKGKSLWNEGTIAAKNSEIGFNALFNMGGNLKAEEHLKIKSGAFINLLGDINAQTLESSSFVNLNAGLVNAWNTNESSIISGNIGLKLPTLDPMKIFTTGGLKRLAKRGLQTAACVYMPGFSTAINAGVSGYGLGSTLKNAWDNRDSFSFSDAYLFDYVDIGCQVSNFAISAKNLYGQGAKVAKQVNSYKAELAERIKASKQTADSPNYSELYKEARDDVSTKLTELYNNATYENIASIASQVKLDSENKDDFSVKQAALSAVNFAATVLGPQYTGQAAFDMNAGTVFSNNINENLFFSVNVGTKAALDSVVMNAYYQKNHGGILAAKGSASLAGNSLVDNGDIQAGNGININYDRVNLLDGGLQEHDNWKINAKILETDGEHEFSHSHLEIENLVNTNKLILTNQGHLKVTNKHTVNEKAEIIIENQSIAEIASQVLGKESTVTVNNQSTYLVQKLEAEKDTQLNILNQSKAVIDHFDQKGNTKVEQNASLAITDEHHLQSGANLEVNKDSTVNAKKQTVYEDAKIRVTHHSELKSESQTIKKGGSVEINDGSEHHSDELNSEQGSKFDIQNDSHSYLKQFNQEGDTIVNRNSSMLILEQHHAKNGSKLDVSKESTVTAKVQIVDQDARIDANDHAKIIAESQTIKSGGSVAINNNSGHYVTGELTTEHGSELNIDNQSSAFIKKFEQSGHTSINNNSSMTVLEEHHLKNGANSEINNSSTLATKKQIADNGSNLIARNHSTIAAETQIMKEGANQSIIDHSAHQVDTLEMEKGTNLTLKNKSQSTIINLDQAGIVNVNEGSEIKIEKHHLKNGAHFNIKNESTATIELQIAENGSQIKLSDKSTQNVSKWVVRHGANCIAEGTKEQAQSIAAKLNERNQLLSVIENEVASLKNEKMQQSHENSIIENTITDLQDKQTTLQRKLANIQKELKNKKKHNSKSLAKLKKEKENLLSQINQVESDIAALETKLGQNKIAHEQCNLDHEKKIQSLQNGVKAVNDSLSKVNCAFIAGEAELDGNILLKDNSLLQMDKPATLGIHAELTGRNVSFIQGKSLASDGHITLLQSSMNMDNQLSFSKNSMLTLHNSTANANDLTDFGKLLYSGSSSITSKNYSHGGVINVAGQKNGKNSLYVNAENGNLHGQANIDNGIFHIDHLVNPTEFAFGQGSYRNYQFTQSLDFSTKQFLHLAGDNYRNCHLDLTGLGINVATKYDSQFNLSLTATNGDITLNKKVHANNISAHASDNIYVNGKKINADHELAFIADKGNIVNDGGVIRGGDHALLIAGNDIKNICREKEYQGKYSRRIKYDPAVIAGGEGSSNNGVGVFIQAGGKFINDASTVLSKGDNYIEGDKGVKFKSRSYSYISDKYMKKGKWGFSERDVIEVDTEVQGSKAISEKGRNIVKSPHGSIRAEAAQFISQQGSDLYAEEHVKLYDVITQQKKYESKSSWWGASHSEQWHKHQCAVPTLILDDGFTRVHANKGNIDSRGTLFLGDGDLKLRAGQDISLSRSILNHSVHVKSHTTVPTFFGMNALNALRNGGTVRQAFSAEDRSIAKVNAMIDSQNAADFAMNTWNLGIDTYNTANSLFKGFNDDMLGSAVLERLGLGGTQGFNPSFGLAISSTDSRSKYQSAGPGCIDRKNMELFAGDKIVFDNGMPVHAHGNAILSADDILLRAAKLTSSNKSQTNTINLGFTPSGGLVNVGGGYSKAQSNSKRYEYAQFKVDQNLDVVADTMNLYGANINAQTITGNINRLAVTSLQDTHQSKDTSWGVSSTGMFSHRHRQNKSAMTNQTSGIQVDQGINHLGNNFHANEVELTAAKITSNGDINPFSDKIVANDLKDFNRTKGFGLSANIHDIARLTDNDQISPGYNVPAIATAGIQVESDDYKATQHATVYGATKTDLNRTSVQGFLNTSNSSGKKVHKDSSMHLHMDVPITNATYITNANNNISQGLAHLFPQKTEVIITQPTVTLSSVVEEAIQPVIEDYADLPPLVPDHENTTDLLKVIPELPEQSSLVDSPLPVAVNSSTSDDVVNPIEDDVDLPPLLTDSEDATKSPKIMRAAPKGQTYDIRTGIKANRFFDIKNGRFNSLNSIVKEIAKNGGGGHLGAKVKLEEKLVDKQYVLWESPNGYEGDHNTIKPSLLFDVRCTYGAEFDLAKSAPKFKFDAGTDIHMNLANGSYHDNPYGNFDYTVDAFSAGASGQAQLNFDGQVKAEARVDVSVMGPSVGGAAQSKTLCFLGLTIQCDVSAKASIGAKATAGVGVTCDKTQPNIRGYFVVGAGFGPCAELEVSPTLGIDPVYHQKVQKEYSIVAERSENKYMTNLLEYEINSVKQQESTSNRSSFWNQYLINSCEEILEDHRDRMYNEAIIKTGYGVDYR